VLVRACLAPRNGTVAAVGIGGRDAVDDRPIVVVREVHLHELPFLKVGEHPGVRGVELVAVTQDDQVLSAIDVPDRADLFATVGGPRAVCPRGGGDEREPERDRECRRYLSAHDRHPLFREPRLDASASP